MSSQSSERQPTVVIAIVNYCTADLTIDCLRSIHDTLRDWPNLEVMVTDNASPDGSGATIAAAIEENGWSNWARLKAMPRNGGFSYGNNGVLREYMSKQEKPDYFWLLNSDTLVRPGALEALLDYAKKNPKAGILGSRLEFPDTTAQHSHFRFPSVASEFESSANNGVISRLFRHRQVAPPISDEIGQYDWLSGASMFIRREVLEDVGLFDETYFLYFEETDFCLRAAKAGWQCWYVPDSHVVHLVGQSTGVTSYTNKLKRRPAYWFESRRHYYAKHYGAIYGALTDLALASGTFLWVIRAKIERRPSHCPDKFFYDLLRHSPFFTKPQPAIEV